MVLAAAGTVALLAALVAFLVAAGSGAWAMRRGRSLPRAFDVATVAGASLLGGCIAILFAAFISRDLSLAYVWSYTHVDHPWYYRAAGLWAGEGGTLLLWALFLAAILLAERRLAKGREKADASSRLHAVAMPILAVATLAVVLLAALERPFASTSAAALAGTPSGRGLDPLLLTPFMLVHPPFEFAAYALTAPLYAYALAYLATDDHAWVRPGFAWMRPAWLVSSYAVGIGALWAYYTLSFGGYWAWDPVETVNLLPWLFVTTFAHALFVHKRGGGFATAAPVFGALAFSAALFATLATRSGLWSASVHAFIPPDVALLPSAGERLRAAADASAFVRTTVGLLVASLLSLGAAWMWRDRRLRLRRAPGHRAADAEVAAGLYVATAVLALALPHVFVGALLAASAGIGLGHTGIGFGILVAVAALVPTALSLRVPPEPREASEAPEAPRAGGFRAFAAGLTEERLLVLAVGVFAVWTFVTVVLLFLGIDGIQRAVFDDRMPLLAAPLLYVLALAFTRRHLAAWLPHAIAAGPALAIAGAVAVRGQPSVGAAGALAVGAAAVLVWSLVAVTVPKGAAAPSRIRLAAAFVLVSAALVLLVASVSPPTRLPGLDARVPKSLVPVGLVLSAGVFVAAFRIPRASQRGVRADLRRAGVPLLHLGLVFLFAGAGLSTYFAEDTVFARDAPLGLGDGRAVGHGLVLALVGSRGEPDPDREGVFRSVDALFELSRDGETVARPVLRMTFVPLKHHYDPTTAVLRFAWGDLYVNSDFENVHAMRFSDPEGGDCGAVELRSSPELDCGWVVGHSRTHEIRSDRLDAVAMTVRTLPGVNVLWAGIVLMVVGMALRIFIQK
ncbi:MAG: cytochrome c biogenesis protein CcsA [Methanobacteriota archaeon]